MSIARHRCLTAGLAAWLAAAIAAPSIASAQTTPATGKNAKGDRAAARDAYDAGTKAFEAREFVAALDAFVKANALIPSAAAMYWIAQSLDKLGRVDDAIAAYQALLARSDEATLSDDKRSTARARLAMLQPAPVAAPAAPLAGVPPVAAEPEPVSVEPAPPPVSPPAPPTPVTLVAPPVHDDAADLLPQRKVYELGVLTGPLFLSKAHGLEGPQYNRGHYSRLTWELGLRAAFFAEKFFGVEAEWAHGFGNVTSGGGVKGLAASRLRGTAGAQFDTLRGHLIGQLPLWRFVPFAVLGAGAVHARSDRLGKNTDFELEFGVGAKFLATRLLVPRIDARLGMTQRNGGGFSEGVAVHPELLLGLSVLLGR
jgi:hypothetical protein